VAGHFGSSKLAKSFSWGSCRIARFLRSVVVICYSQRQAKVQLRILMARMEKSEEIGHVLFAWFSALEYDPEKCLLEEWRTKTSPPDSTSNSDPNEITDLNLS
jgi:hypothetical protein